MSYFIEGLKVLLGVWMFLAFMFVVAIIMAMLPQKRHRHPRVLWHDCPDEVVRVVEMPYDWASERPFDESEWEARFADEGRVS